MLEGRLTQVFDAPPHAAAWCGGEIIKKKKEKQR